jgi:hypothetical protein
MLTRLLALARALLAGVNLRLWLTGAAALAVLVLATGLYLKGRSDQAAADRPQIAAALARAQVQGLEAEGAQATAQRVQQADARRRAADAAATTVTTQALRSEDAHEDLSPDIVARLGAADRQLCLADPQLAGCPTDRDAR